MTKVRKSGVYKIECLPTKKVYIGRSQQIYTRWAQHRSKLRNNKHINHYLQNSWNKYGQEQFKFSIIEELPKDNQLLEERELMWMKIFDSTNNDYGFNIKHSTITKAFEERNKGTAVKTKELKNKIKREKRLKSLRAYSIPNPLDEEIKPVKIHQFNTLDELAKFVRLEERNQKLKNKIKKSSLITYLANPQSNSKWGYVWKDYNKTGCDLINNYVSTFKSGEYTPEHLKAKPRKSKTGFKWQSSELAEWKSNHLSGKPRPKRRKPFILDGVKYNYLEEYQGTLWSFYKAKREGRVQYLQTA